MVTAMVMRTERVEAELPSKAQLKTLPLRALVALASRAVRRVQSLYRSEHPRCAEVIEQTLVGAEAYARGEAAEFSLTELKFAAKFGRDGTARQVAAATSYLAYGVLAAQAAGKSTAGEETCRLPVDPTRFMLPSPDADAVDAHQVAYRCWMSLASAYNADPDVSFLYTVMEDFGYLSVMCEGRFPAAGEAIEASADGPLGSLWCNSES